MTRWTSSPPSIASYFLHWALPEALKEPVMGDLEEEFTYRAQDNLTKARNWYRKQAVRSALQFLWKTKKGLLMFIISVLVFIALTVMAMILGGGIDMFMDVPSVALVFVPAIFFTIGSTSLHSIKQGFNALINEEASFEKLELINAKQSFHVMGQIALLTGIFSTLIGAIAIGSMISAEDFSTVFGPACAVCILTLTYGFGLKTLAYVAEQKLQYKLNQLTY